MEIRNHTQTLNQNQNHNPNQHQNGGVEKFDQPEKRPKIECKTPMMQEDAPGNSLEVKEIFITSLHLRATVKVPLVLMT